MSHHILLAYLIVRTCPNPDVRLWPDVQLQTVQVRLEPLLNRNWFVTVQHVSCDVDSRRVQEVVKVETCKAENWLEQFVAFVLVWAFEELTDFYHFLQYVREGLMLSEELDEFFVLEDILKNHNHVLVKLHVLKALKLNSSLYDVEDDWDLVERVEDCVFLQKHWLHVRVVVSWAEWEFSWRFICLFIGPSIGCNWKLFLVNVLDIGSVRLYGLAVLNYNLADVLFRDLAIHVQALLISFGGKVFDS